MLKKLLFFESFFILENNFLKEELV